MNHAIFTSLKSHKREFYPKVNHSCNTFAKQAFVSIDTICSNLMFMIFSHGQHDTAAILLQRGARFVANGDHKNPLDLCVEVTTSSNRFASRLGARDRMQPQTVLEVTVEVRLLGVRVLNSHLLHIAQLYLVFCFLYTL